ncbi:hypothetical protein NA57DRAFT_80591 [Rhizodiscina lignyota]|uniref:F-box domain-containing protein n=1 Tax=Rhizodiscina lignyota TaxID=1504668 RepID=A0A9P4I388_9PEZI|nr:hypothetical protein NA57DRAFT_80591 [Rhizodiscina lignyota]
MATSPAHQLQNPFPFLQLPQELRVQIYNYVVEDLAVGFRRYASSIHSVPRPILRIRPHVKQAYFKLFHVNRQIREEAMDEILSRSVVKVFHSDLLAMLQLFESKERALVKHLSIMGLVKGDRKSTRLLQTIHKSIDLSRCTTDKAMWVDVALDGIKDLDNGPLILPNLSSLRIEMDLSHLGL